MPERLDTGALPLTEPHAAPIFDTGPHPQPLPSRYPPEPAAVLVDPDNGEPTEITEVIHVPDSEPAQPLPVPARSVAVTGQYHYLKRWKFLLLLIGVWIVAAAAGVGLYYWWYHALDKTWPDFGVLVYVIACMVAALLVSMVEPRPVMSATAIAVMSAPLASAGAAAALYGMYVFGWVTP